MTAHIAVVPVEDLGVETDRALRYASTLAPRVVALHIAARDATGLARQWAATRAGVPLVMLPAGSHAVIPRALALLKRSERAQRVTLVVRPGSGAQVLGSGVVVREVPGAFGQQ